MAMITISSTVHPWPIDSRTFLIYGNRDCVTTRINHPSPFGDVLKPLSTASTYRGMLDLALRRNRRAAKEGRFVADWKHR
jgi:hypothetical protein